MDISEEQFENTRRVAEQKYKAIVKVPCPYLQRDVHFDTDGFEHLLFKSWNRTRSRVEQYTRLRLVPLAKKLLQMTTTLQEYERRAYWVRQHSAGRWSRQLREVRYYGFVAVFPDRDVRIKIIVKEIEGAAPHFYSLYPAWKVVTDAEGQRHKRLYTGDPETD